MQVAKTAWSIPVAALVLGLVAACESENASQVHPGGRPGPGGSVGADGDDGGQIVSGPDGGGADAGGEAPFPTQVRFVDAGNWSPNGVAYYGQFGTWVQPLRAPGSLCGVAVSNPQGFDVAFSNATDRFVSDGLWSMPFSGVHGTFVAPVGDGVADLIAVTAQGILVRFQNGLGWGNHWNEEPPSGNMTAGVPFFGNGGTFFADVTGDGEAEAIAIDSGGIHVRRMTHAGRDGGLSGFGALEIWSTSTLSGIHGTFFADLTGDGKADAVEVNGTSTPTVTVRRSSGKAFGPDETWYSSPGGDLSSAAWVLPADVNGDGTVDLVYQTATGVRVLYSDGSRLRTTPASTPSYALDGRPAAPHGVFACDVTGDGRADLLFFDEHGIQVYRAVQVDPPP